MCLHSLSLSLSLIHTFMLLNLIFPTKVKYYVLIATCIPQARPVRMDPPQNPYLMQFGAYWRLYATVTGFVV